MARILSNSYYNKTATVSVISRQTGKSAQEIYKYVRNGVIVPQVDEYSGFNLFSMEDADIVDLCEYCRTKLGFSLKSMPYLIALIKEMLPDRSIAEVKEIFQMMYQVVEVQEYRKVVNPRYKNAFKRKEK